MRKQELYNKVIEYFEKAMPVAETTKNGNRLCVNRNYTIRL